MTRPHMKTVASAALASAAAFFVLTRSGLAGTLAGAAVASMVYTGTSHWAGQGLERAARWWLARRGGATETMETDVAGAAPAGIEVVAAAAPRATRAAAASGSPSLRRLARTWGPVVLGVLALSASGYSLVTGSPLERVIIRERVVEKPVVQERVVVHTETVTVTVPANGGQSTPTTTKPPLGATTTSSTTSTTQPSPTTTTTAPPVTTTTAPPPSGN